MNRMGKEIFTAILFYIPFLFIIAFVFLALLLGIACILSGTILVLVLAMYGLYAFLREFGLLEYMLKHFQSVWTYIHNDIYKNIQESFRLNDVEKLPKTNALFICFPHGLLGHSWLLHFCYQISTWPHPIPRPFLAVHSIFFRIPFLKDVAELFHCIEAKEDIIASYLKKGHSVAILVGGVQEMLYNGSQPIKLIVKKRKGYIRIAKSCQVPIVPMFTVGENELFPNETWWPWKTLSDLVFKWTHIPLPLPSWQSVKSWVSILKKPLETPVQTFVLDTVNIKDKNEQQIKKEVLKTLQHFIHEKKLAVEIIG